MTTNNASQYWLPWIHASICKHFDDNKGSLTLRIEGEEAPETRSEQSYFELRVDGPTLILVSKSYWKVKIEVNVLVTTVMDDENLYLHQETIGKVVDMFEDVLRIYKYGKSTDPNNDSSLFVCLNIDYDRHARGGDALIVSNFGQIDKTTRIQQASVEAHYVGYFNTGD